jgi:phage gp29-like protein
MNIVTRLFAAKTPEKQPDKPQTGDIYTGHAVEELISMLTQMPDPDEVLKEAGLGREDLRKLEGDDEISTALETRQDAVSATPWRIEPGEGPEFDFAYPQVKAFIEKIIQVAWAAIPYGYSVGEMVYEKKDGKIVWKTFEERPFEWFEPKSDGRLIYRPVNRGGEINVFEEWPAQFFLTRRKPSYRQPYGQALLTRLYWPWFFRNAGWRFWARFLERFGSPLLIGQTNGNTADMAKALARAVQSAVAAVGVDDKVTAIGPGNSGESFRHFSDAVDKRIQKVVLGQTLTTDVGSGGSYAAAKVHDLVRDDRRMADCGLIAVTIQAMIDTLMMLNGKPAGTLTFIMEDETGLQIERATRDVEMAKAGIIKFTEEYLLRAYDFDPEDFTIPAAAPATPPEPEPGKGGKQPPAATPAAKAAALFAATSPKFSPAQTALEDLAEDTLAQAGQPIPPAAIRAAIRASTTPEDLMERLAALFDGNDAAEFQAIAERALFAADVLGYVHMEAQDA